MKKFEVTAYVFRKVACCNPEEPTTLKALHRLDMEDIQSIRMGRCFLIVVKAPGEQEVRQIAEKACEKLLTNPVMEQFEIEKIEEVNN